MPCAASCFERRIVFEYATCAFTIDESHEGAASDDFKRVQRGKLDALLALAEAHDCRRVRLLAYFGETSQPCGNCDHCVAPPATWDGTEAARKALS